MVAMDFGKLISKLLNYTGTKNQALALELGYDVSYLSRQQERQSNLPENCRIYHGRGYRQRTACNSEFS